MTRRFGLKNCHLILKQEDCSPKLFTTLWMRRMKWGRFHARCHSFMERSQRILFVHHFSLPSNRHICITEIRRCSGRHIPHSVHGMTVFIRCRTTELFPIHCMETGPLRKTAAWKLHRFQWLRPERFCRRATAITMHGCLRDLQKS